MLGDHFIPLPQPVLPYPPLCTWLCNIPKKKVFLFCTTDDHSTNSFLNIDKTSFVSPYYDLNVLMPIVEQSRKQSTYFIWYTT